MRARGVVTASLVVTMIVGVLNSIYKTDKLPSFRFFFGTGVLWLFLSGLAEAEEELAKAIAIAVATFTLLGEGGGVLNHFLGADNTKVTLNTDPNSNNPKQGFRVPASSSNVVTASQARRETGLPTTSAAPGFAPIKPVVPNGVVIHDLSASNNGL